MIALRVARAVLGWKLGEAADIVGLDAGSLRRMEQGLGCPSSATLSVIRAAYGEALDTAEMHYGPVQVKERGRPRLERDPQTEPVA